MLNPLRRRPRLEDEGPAPDYRFSLANERTFLAYVRTALALTAGGVALVQLAGDVGPSVLRRLTALLLIAGGFVVAVISQHRWYTVERALRRDEPLPAWQLPLWLATLVAVAVLGVGLLVALETL